ncbi:hypothetical protein F2Q70_00038270 [Brassica cretica]|uniref:Uncharacterized protein n=1 Tax=Brassica cretica TaxID=69181 RepID=A0A8S9K9U3_BRACR|nr:hypothetical protein F2Q70_00038270 [Brassica cretica]
MDFKNIHAIPHMDHMDRNFPIDTMGVVFNTEAHFDDSASPRMGRGQVTVVLKMWRVWKFLSYFGPPDLWLETEGGLSDFRFNPRLSEVEEFRQSLLSSDPYV